MQFGADDGRRCTEEAFLEFHHIVPHAVGGPTTAENIQLRCRAHNGYEAERDFGRRLRLGVREGRASYTHVTGQRHPMSLLWITAGNSARAEFNVGLIGRRAQPAEPSPEVSETAEGSSLARGPARMLSVCAMLVSLGQH